MGKYDSGVNLYKAFKNCLEEGKDKERLKRLEGRLDSFNNSLAKTEQEEYCFLLIQQGLIVKDSVLGKVIMAYQASFKDFGA